MSSVQAHPEDRLLPYLDGELPESDARSVRHHLKECEPCRTEVEELQSTLAACVRYRNKVLQGHFPPPPSPWADLTAEFARIDSELAQESWGARLGRWFGLGAPRLQRWAMSAAAAAIVAVGVYYQVIHTPSVEAATLLRRAVAATAARPAPAKPVRMRGNYRDRSALPSMLRAAGYTGEPLSVIAFRQWRDSLAAKRDQVEALPGDSHRIRTEAAEGDLASASITLANDLHPVASRFEFRDRQWVEYEEISDSSATDGGTPAVSRLDVPTRRVVPSRPSALSSGESASVSEELRVIAALHEIGADLGDPLEITRAGGQVEVSGVGVRPERQSEIHRALDPLPNVTVQFTNPTAASTPPAMGTDAPPLKTEPAPRSPLEARLAQQIGSRAALEKFSASTLDALENAMTHAYALNSLAQRFPEGTPMSDADRALLAELAASHLKTLSSQITELHRTLAPVLASLGGATAQGRPATQARVWQAGAEETFAASRRVEVLLSTLLGATAEPPGPRVPTDLLAAFANLQGAIEDCRKLL